MLAAYAGELASARAGRQPRKLTRATIARKLAAVRGAAPLRPRPRTSPRQPGRAPARPAAPGHAQAARRSTPSSSALSGDDPLALRNRALLELVYSAGLRSAEAVDLDLGDVDFEQEAVRVRGKGDKERVVPLGEEAAYRVRLYLEDAPAGARARRRGCVLPLRARQAAGHEHAQASSPPPAPAPPCVRDPPARGRRRPPRDPGAARAQLALDDPGVQPRRRPPPTQGL